MGMAEYLIDARKALAEFDAASVAFMSALQGNPDWLKLQPQKLEKIKRIVSDLPNRTKVIENSLSTTEKTAVDITDLQHRLETESESLASALGKLGDALEGEPLPVANNPVLTLEEHAKRVATALFPNAVEGIQDINRTLWEFRIITADFDRVFAEEEAKKRLTADQLATVRATADTIKARFDDANELLNQVTVSRQGDAKEVNDVVRKAREAMAGALKAARDRDGDAFKSFRGLLGRAEDLAHKIDGKVSDIRIPIFPTIEGLTEFNLIDASNYDRLAGVQRMALLNIAARLRSITFDTGSDDHLLSPRFGLRVFEVFPDRFYFTVEKDFLEKIEGMAKKGMFEKAPASLHKFKDGSYKQKAFSKGNLQVSYQEIKDGEHKGRFNVDADIDLYRSPLRHLFGEVLVNHLTGNTTDQFRVFKILAENKLTMLAGFDILRLA